MQTLNVLSAAASIVFMAALLVLLRRRGRKIAALAQELDYSEEERIRLRNTQRALEHLGNEQYERAELLTQKLFTAHALKDRAIDDRDAAILTLQARAKSDEANYFELGGMVAKGVATPIQKRLFEALEERVVMVRSLKHQLSEVTQERDRLLVLAAAKPKRVRKSSAKVSALAGKVSA